MQKKVRVLHLLYALGVGGAERRVLRLGLGLDADRYDIHALSLRPVVGATLPWPPERHTYFPIPSGLHRDRLLGLARFMREGQFDVVHTHNWATMFYGVLAAKLARVPVVLHGEHGRNEQDRAGVPLRRDIAAATLARLATRVVAVNESIAADVQGRWKLPTSRIVCVPNGVDLGRFKPRSERGPDTGRDADEFVIGTIARFDAIKNLPCLIRAFERLVQAQPQLKVRLVLVGAGPELEALSQQARQGAAASKIDFVGETATPEQWYPRFDLFANTSHSEGMSNSVLEAMACGVPIVASAIAGNLCWLHDGSNALFFPSDDDAALAAHMQRFATEPGLAQRMGAENLRRVHAEYDNSMFLQRYDALYQKLLNTAG